MTRIHAKIVFMPSNLTNVTFNKARIMQKETYLQMVLLAYNICSLGELLQHTKNQNSMTILKSTLVIVLFASLTSTSLAQAAKKSPLPPIKELPKVGEVKSFYELPEVVDYKVYDSTGKLYAKGNAQFVDVTNYPKGTYFFAYNGQKVAHKID